MKKNKQKAVYFTPENIRKIEKMRKQSGETASGLINRLIAQTPAVAGSPADFYTEFLSVYESYLSTAVERGIMDKETRMAAANAYEFFVKELAKHTSAEAIMARMAVQN